MKQDRYQTYTRKAPVIGVRLRTDRDDEGAYLEALEEQAYETGVAVSTLLREDAIRGWRERNEGQPTGNPPLTRG